MKEYELKALAKSRRNRMLSDIRDGISWADRSIEPKNVYKRTMKYRPRLAEEWEEMED